MVGKHPNDLRVTRDAVLIPVFTYTRVISKNREEEWNEL